MAQDSVGIYKAQWDIEVTLDPTGTQFAENIGKFIVNRVDGKLNVGGPVTMASPAQFTFNKSLFVSLIKALTPTQDAEQGRKKIADAWLAATTASTMVVSPGAYVGAPVDPTKFSVIIATVIVPAAGYASLLAGLLAAPIAGTALTTKFPEELQKAFSLVTFAISGLNSQKPPDGPLPLSIVGTAL